MANLIIYDKDNYAKAFIFKKIVGAEDCKLLEYTFEKDIITKCEDVENILFVNCCLSLENTLELLEDSRVIVYKYCASEWYPSVSTIYHEN